MLDVNLNGHEYGIRLLRSGSSAPVVVDEGKTVTLEYQVLRLTDEPNDVVPSQVFDPTSFVLNDGSNKCYVGIEAIDFYGKMTTVRAPVASCNYLRDFLENAQKDVPKQKRRRS